MKKHNLEKYGYEEKGVGFAKGFIAAMILVAIVLILSQHETIVELIISLIE